MSIRRKFEFTDNLLRNPQVIEDMIVDVSISLEEAKEANALIANTMVTQRSSTAQDLVRGKKTEIDFLNGYIVDLGKKHGIPVPYNETIVAMVKMLEQGKQD